MSHPLSQIPHNAAVMVDVNVFVYALTPQSNLHYPCRELLERGAYGEVTLYTTVSVVADVLHRAMVLEVLAQKQVQRSADAVALLKQQPDIVAGLTRYRTILRDLRQARIDILALTYRDLHASRVYREHHGLLVNDSLIVAVMQRERMSFLATNDSDFERVPHIVAYMPNL
ncbi:MAG: type II toxin-antitoxin system VapC family toxin [Chloroflexaceae bacterium]|nr:type II toxin-antitoxin system VapC family toxin [Chloroflexaceae bacterium]